ncbi:ATP-dependent Clp protease proteolytic subunit 1 [Clostridium saccharobutylicum]|uniref:head maturation protease, ClpP-related n=1 Tax=Clostridium saccharobutylicum TaxID=169679 RepID=UPI000983C3A5|nr:head maturation protease, ClpP-related [Clostridium saccharobutylicum]AQS09678.1 ATP-dependent Clp protease proteolytic subunit 1 [Clostridium saccharobutylicum]MBC2436927.1 Clp protease ClpP [Clostridium saccharobutylicum]NSB89278.1 ATP-dependent Clp endopeptidase proteolytic subunit ClpP [Clostridium saccharobutylicum]NYC27932.1 ATP-dependent Clp endopeptidase proteolytic subunit ClpP [Clostridium saccharobutylicum]OOM17127.1 ATP-dependent Clp protease proteolytic subunit 1 [Clostridium s
MKNKCIEFKNSLENEQSLYFYGDIVSDEWGKWTDTDACPQDVLDILGQINESQPLNIYVNSGGGSVFAGMAIYNMLKRCKSEKTVYIDGVAGSISSVLAMSGDKIVMPSNSYLMIHNAWVGAQGNAKDLRKMADTLDKISEGILNVYQEKLADGVDISTIKQLMDEETWLTGTDASKYFNIELVEANKAVAYCLDILNYENIPDTIKNKVNTKEHIEEDITDKTNDTNNEEIELLELAKAKLRLKLL